MPVTIETNGDTMVARLSGELDHHHTQKLREEIDRNVQKERPVLKKAGSVSTKLRRRGTVFRKSRKKKPGKWNFHSEKPPVDSLVDEIGRASCRERV